ncbi:MAG TPA: Uma2 family endonuclease, partial [Chloroflexota bacterium]|nr:Uma2 family endonuclease [Chloroflexota bacterium]
DDGVPALVVEVLSETTWRYDRDTVGGKAFGYMQLGVPEILLFDPTEEYLEHQCVGWRRGDQGYQAWRPDAAGRFQSMSLGVAFAAEGILLRVYDTEGQPIPFRGERARMLAEERRGQAEQMRTLAERDAEIVRLRAEVRRLAGNKEES